MPIDGMTKMYISFVAIFFMFVCNFLMIFARKTSSGLLRFLLKTLAFIIILGVLVMILIVVL